MWTVPQILQTDNALTVTKDAKSLTQRVSEEIKQNI